MTRKRIIGICIGISGIILLMGAAYINKQVEQGKKDVTSAQEKIDQGKNLFNLTPITGEIGQKTFVNPIEKKIASGEAEIAKYETLANRLQIGGIILIVAGIIICLLPSKKGTKSKS